MMRKSALQKICALVLLITLVLAQTVVGFADEGGSSPKIVLAGDNAYEVEAGKTNTIKVQLKNKGNGSADNIYVQAKNSGTSPIHVSVRSSDIGSMGINGTANVTLDVKIDGDVKESSYSFGLDYTYSNDNSTFSGSDTVYLKMKGFDKDPNFALDSMVLSPDSLSPGNAATLTGKVVNNGGQDMFDVDISLENLSADKISLSGGFSNKHAAKVMVGESVGFTFPLVASADMAAGNYPVDIKLTFKDAYGKAIEKKQQYYVNVGGVAGQKAQLEIRNMKEPSGTYGVNQNFTITFDLHNAGKVAAKSIVVTAEGLDPAGVVPKSGSVKTVAVLEPGASTSLSFTFAGTAAAKTQNYAVQFTTEYTSGGTAVTSFKQFAGVNVSNPDKDEENASKPKIIVSKYQSNPLIVMAGDEFDLNMTLMNTHKDKGVKNIKMFLTLAEEKSSDTEKSGNIFTPVNSSNTFYFDSIPAKGSVDKSLRLYVVPEAQPKTYTLTVNFEYEDSTGKEYTGTELLGINVKQVTSLQMDEFTVPETVEMFMPVSISFGYFNTGKVTLNNVMIKVEGDVEVQNRNTYIGNMDSGNSDFFETTLTPTTPGEVPVSIILSYEDATGELKEERRDMVLNVVEPMIPEEGEGMDPQNPPIDMKKMAITLTMIAIFAMGLFVFVKKQKGDPKDSFSESADMNLDDEDDDDDDNDKNDEEGMSV